MHDVNSQILFQSPHITAQILFDLSPPSNRKTVLLATMVIKMRTTATRQTSEPVEPPEQLHAFRCLPDELQLTIWQAAIDDLRVPGDVCRFNLDISSRPWAIKGKVTTVSPVAETKTMTKTYYGLLGACTMSRHQILKANVPTLTLHRLSRSRPGRPSRAISLEVPFDYEHGTFCVDNLATAAKQAVQKYALTALNPLTADVRGVKGYCSTLHFAPRIRRLAIGLPDCCLKNTCDQKGSYPYEGYHLGEDHHLVKDLLKAFCNAKDLSIISTKAIRRQRLLSPTGLSSIVAACRRPILPRYKAPDYTRDLQLCKAWSWIRNEWSEREQRLVFQAGSDWRLWQLVEGEIQQAAAAATASGSLEEAERVILRQWSEGTPLRSTS